MPFKNQEFRKVGSRVVSEPILPEKQVKLWSLPLVVCKKMKLFLAFKKPI